jgi:hypothetical protein
MENSNKFNEATNDLFVRVKSTKTPKNKTELELLEKTTMIAVDVNESQIEASNVLDVNIHIQSRAAGSKLTKADAGKA